MKVTIELNDLEQRMMEKLKLIHGNSETQVVVNALYKEFRGHHPVNTVQAAASMRQALLELEGEEPSDEDEDEDEDHED